MSAPSVLIVDDLPQTRRILADLFKTQGWDVRTAGRAGDAITALDPAPDCVIIDVILPDGPGELVVQKIRALGLSARVVIVATAASDPARLASVAEFRPDLIVKKPIDWDIVVRYCQSEVARDRSARGGATEAQLEPG